MIKKHFQIQPDNGKYQLKYDPTINAYGHTDEYGIISFGDRGLQSKAVAFTTFTHENTHFVNNHVLQYAQGKLTEAQVENLANRNEILTARSNLPFRELSNSLKEINGRYFLNPDLIPQNKIRASHIFYNIIR